MNQTSDRAGIPEPFKRLPCQRFQAGLSEVCGQVNDEIVKRSDVGKFVVLPTRWIVERTIAWLNRCRRLGQRLGVHQPERSPGQTLKAAIRRLMGSTWQRYRVHWMRNAQSCVSKAQQNMVSAALRQTFRLPARCCATSPTSCGPSGRSSARSSTTARPTCWPTWTSPASHRAMLHSTNPLERLNKEVKRRADVVGIFFNERFTVRLIGAVLLEANDEWQLQHRNMQTEIMAELTPTLIETITPQIATPAAWDLATSTTPQIPPR